MSACAYCGKARGHTTDHLITRAQARRNPKAAYHRNDARFKVRSCLGCNVAKGTRLRVPPSHADVIAELEEITHGKYAVWSGDAEGLRDVLK